MNLLLLWNNTFALTLVLVTTILVMACVAAARFRLSAVTKNGILLPSLVIVSAMPAVLAASRGADWNMLIPILPADAFILQSENTPADAGLAPAVSTTPPPAALASSDPRDPTNATVTSAKSGTGWSPWTVFFLVWAAGALVCLVRLGRSYLSLWRLLANAHPVTDARVAAAAEHARSTLGMQRFPTILVSSHVSSPVAVGTPRHGWVIWPSGMLQNMPRQQLEHVLVHEGAHVAHRDTALRLVQGLIAALWWWHPLVHLLNRQLSRAREELCDNAVLSSTDAIQYGQTLLEIGRPSNTSPSPALAVTLFPEHERLENRIRSLLNPRRSTVHQSTPFVTVAACITGVAVAAFAGATQLTTASPEPIMHAADSYWLAHADRTLAKEYFLELPDDERPGQLDIDIKRGDIIVTAYGGERILVRLSIPNAPPAADGQDLDGYRSVPSKPLDFEVRQDGNRIELDGNAYDQTTHIEVLVPRRIDLTLDSYSAGIIRVDGVEGHIRARSQNNDITLKDIAGSADVYGYHGDFSATFRDVRGELSFETYNGDIDLALPANLRATTFLRVEREQVQSQFEIVTRPPAAIETRLPDGTSTIDFGKYVIGEINGGGIPAVVETTNGIVTLRTN